LIAEESRLIDILETVPPRSLLWSHARLDSGANRPLLMREAPADRAQQRAA
jgi:hypothetical protein